ncbi:MAG: DNA repair protein RadC [Bacteroidales bacterium]|nr:DNA repair protein RadC [Bacteroidales bacterium]
MMNQTDIYQDNTPISHSSQTSILIRDLNSDEKPREKAGRLGLESLTDVELLALLLGSGMSGKSVLDLAREILQDNDNKLSRLSRMSIAELKKKYKGVGTAKATLLAAAMTFGARVQKSLSVIDEQMVSSVKVYNYMRSTLERLNYEEFWVIHLNRANMVLTKELISRGGIAGTAVDIKLIAKSAIDHLSSGIILIHNHPSGNMQPSGQDDNLTRRIKDICKIIDVKVQDHLIIGPTGYYSYCDNGRL